MSTKSASHAATDHHHHRSAMQEWNDRKNYKSDDSYSEMSDTDNFLAKGAFLITPSHELTIDRAAVICEKMSFKGYFSLTKTATGILFKFSHPEDFQAVFRKGFHRVTGARFYKKVAIPCRPQKTFTLFVYDVPEDVPEEDIRHSLYRFNSIVEVVRLEVEYKKNAEPTSLPASGTSTPKPGQKMETESVNLTKETSLPPIRITLASLEEYNSLLTNGLDFYGATFFPTDAELPSDSIARVAIRRGRLTYKSIAGQVRELLPVFDASGFTKIPPPASKTMRPGYHGGK
ncbi:uncharacterized protein LOC134833154 [Culicoides brevitarsis]|uniref:uncharacterized protein LOC134833154 n=1 Tax=Culicoides brevitarsis TaxID=469753 RepID=UPI00307C09DA